MPTCGKVSSYLISKYVPLLHDMGIAWVEDQYDAYNRKTIKTLRLLSIRELKIKYKDYRKHQIKVYKDDSLKTTCFKLKAIAVSEYIAQQKYVIYCKTVKQFLRDNPNEGIDPKKLRKINKVVNKTGEEFKVLTFLSSRKAKSKFGINQSDFKRFKNFTKHTLGWSWNSWIREVEPYNYWDYLYGFYRKNLAMVYWNNGCLIRHYPTSVNITKCIG